MPSDPIAIPISFESDTVALEAEAPDEDTVTPVEVALHPAEMILEGAPRAEASYVGPAESAAAASSRIDK